VIFVSWKLTNSHYLSLLVESLEDSPLLDSLDTVGKIQVFSGF